MARNKKPQSKKKVKKKIGKYIYCSFYYNLKSERMFERGRIVLSHASIYSWKSKTRVTSYELQVQIHELRVQIHKLRVQIYELRVQIHELED